MNTGSNRCGSPHVGAALAVAMLSSVHGAMPSASGAERDRPEARGASAPPLTVTGRARSTRRDVIDGAILAHRELKARSAGLPAAERERLHESMGLAVGEPDSEAVAIYVHARLGEDEIAALAVAGIRVNRSVFVPPVLGRHPHGFHLARVDFTALDRLRGDGRVVRVASTEHLLVPQHEIARGVVGIESVHAGDGVGPFFGKGVTVVVADSGLDPAHPDLPVPVLAYDVTTGTSADEWSTDVANTVISHGTHVTGTVVGSGGLSGGVYRGGAPGADLVFHKIGNNANGSSTFTDMIESVMHAASIGADVYTVSYGGYETFLDGSSPIAQAFDAAFEMGTLCFTSAGNSAQRRRHWSAPIAPGGGIGFTLTIENDDDTPYGFPILLRVIWRDDEIHDDLNMVLECLSLAEGETLEVGTGGTSPRNTESLPYVLTPSIPPETERTYTFQLSNSAGSGGTPLVHIYQVSTSIATFDAPDPFYTVGTPAEADTVLAVGAWVHRKTWVDFLGINRSSSQTVDTLASFSSRGPRVDGALKPDIVAPGSMTISLRDGEFANSPSSMISNDGINDGSGPADYYVAQGTSMASPLAAAGAVLLREARPSLAVAQHRERIVSTASQAEMPDMLVGHGMIDVVAAIGSITADLDRDGTVDGSDLGLLLASWGACLACVADLDGDGEVGGSDLGLLLAAWDG